MNFTLKPQYKRAISFLLVLMLAVTGILFGPLPISVQATSPPTFYRPGDAIIIDNTISFSGISTNPNSASVMIANYQNGDRLEYSPIHNISGSFNYSSGKLSLTGNATIEQYQEALRSVKFSTTSTSNVDRTIDFSLGNAIYYGGHYYEFVTGTLTWEQAKTAAEGRSLYGRTGYLATLTSEGENAFVASKVQGIGWIGARDIGRDYNTGATIGTYGDWRWVTGPEGDMDEGKGLAFYSGYVGGSVVNSLYKGWDHGEPNNWSGIEWVAHIFPNGTWNDYSPTNTRVAGYVVEYPGDGSGDSATLTQSRTVQVKSAPLTVTFDLQGVNVTLSPSSKSVTSGAAYGELPDPDGAAAGYSFEGWYTGTGGYGSLITSTSTFTGTSNQTLYAKWSDIQSPTTGSGVTIDAITSASRVISYSPSTDNNTPSAELLYKVVYSTSAAFNTTSEAFNATEYLDWTPYEKRTGWAPYRNQWVDYNHVISGLTPNTQYWINVLVKDEAGNLSIYQSATSTAGVTYTGITSSDTTPPVTSGASAVVTTSGAVTLNSIPIEWPRAYDIGGSSPDAIEYMIVYSTNSAIGTSVQDALRYGTIVNFSTDGKKNEWTTYSATALTPNATVTGLKPHTRYYITVIAKDPDGNATVYSQLGPVDTAGYTPPIASNVIIQGTADSVSTLTGIFTYSHADSYSQQETLFKWYSYDSDGTKKLIRTVTKSGVVTGDALLLSDDAVLRGKKISFEVTPIASVTGILETVTGAAVESAKIGPINTRPYVESVGINGTLRIGSTLTGVYTYHDADNDLEYISNYQWYRADDASGTSKAAITGLGETSYTVTSEDLGKYLSFSVLPFAKTGVYQGQTVESALTGPVAAASSGRGSSKTADLPVPAPVINPANNEVNGQPAIENTRTENKDGGTQTIVSLDSNKTNTLVNQMEKSSTLVIPAPMANTSGTDSTQVRMNVEQLDQLCKQEVTLKIDNGQVQYALPPKAIDTDNLVAQFGNGVNPASILFDITISEAPDKMIKVIQNTAAKNGFSVMVPPIEFNVTAAYNGKSLNLNQFSQHVTREIKLPAGVDLQKITTAIVVKEDGTTYHVPTYVYQINGQYYARINSLTNSVYALISYEANFPDTKDQWFEAPVAEAASRKILNGYTDSTFRGNGSITRAEFAAMIVNTLGLDKIGTSNYTDVKESNWFYGAVSKASEYKVVSGRQDGSFDPKAYITRQEAMIMMQRAAELCGMTVTGKDLTGNYDDSQKVSAWAKDAVKFNLETGLITGSNGELRPKDYISRAEAAVVILRLLQKSGLIDVRTQL